MPVPCAASRGWNRATRSARATRRAAPVGARGHTGGDGHGETAAAVGGFATLPGSLQPERRYAPSAQAAVAPGRAYIPPARSGGTAAHARRGRRVKPRIANPSGKKIAGAITKACSTAGSDRREHARQATHRARMLCERDEKENVQSRSRSFEPGGPQEHVTVCPRVGVEDGDGSVERRRLRNDAERQPQRDRTDQTPRGSPARPGRSPVGREVVTRPYAGATDVHGRRASHSAELNVWGIAVDDLATAEVSAIYGATVAAPLAARRSRADAPERRAAREAVPSDG
jgi:hypothetical protein